MEFDSNSPVLKPLLIINSPSSYLGTQKHLLPFPNNDLFFEHTLSTIHSALHSAPAIYISVHSPVLQPGIQFRLDDPASLFTPTSINNDDHHVSIPELKLIPAATEKSKGPEAELLAAHDMHPEAKWLMLPCGYPLLPGSALQQLILEYEDPVTCFVNEHDSVEMIGIWSLDALERLRGSVEGNSGESGVELGDVVRGLGGKLVRPLREEWIRKAETEEEWEGGFER